MNRDNELLKAIVENINKARPTDKACPHCGSQIYDPFTGKNVWHEPDNCKSIPKLNASTNGQ